MENTQKLYKGECYYPMDFQPIDKIIITMLYDTLPMPRSLLIDCLSVMGYKKSSLNTHISKLIKNRFIKTFKADREQILTFSDKVYKILGVKDGKGQQINKSQIALYYLSAEVLLNSIETKLEQVDLNELLEILFCKGGVFSRFYTDRILVNENENENKAIQKIVEFDKLQKELRKINNSINSLKAYKDEFANSKTKEETRLKALKDEITSKIEDLKPCLTLNSKVNDKAVQIQYASVYQMRQNNIIFNITTNKFRILDINEPLTPKQLKSKIDYILKYQQFLKKQKVIIEIWTLKSFSSIRKSALEKQIQALVEGEYSITKGLKISVVESKYA